MSFWDNPIVQSGVFKLLGGGYAYEALTGAVWPGTVAKIKTETKEAIEKASGGADPAIVKERQAQAEREIDLYLRKIDAHPADAGFRFGELGSYEEALASLQKLAYALMGLAVVGVGAYFSLALIRTFRRK